MPSTKPRLCLTMIVKNESKIIKRCLDGVKKYIDYWVIVDTGSTDDTKSIIKKELSKIPGELHESEFINFSHNRNESIELSKAKADYLLLMDADLELKVTNPSFKNDLKKIDAEAFLINECEDLKDGLCAGFNYRTKKIISTKREWHFVGSTHEVIEPKDGERHEAENFDGVFMHNRYDGGSKSDKFERDVRLLTEEIKKAPDNSRTMFYLAESYFNLHYRNKENPDYLDNAIYWYKKRASCLISWEQEVYYSLFKLAKANSIKNNYFDFAGYLKAYDFMPSRLEPIHQIVRYCRENEYYRIGYIIGKAALDNRSPLPDDALFVDGDVYSFQLMDETAICASWSGHNEESCEMIESIIPVIQGYVSEENEDRIKDNLKICRNLMDSKV